MAAEPARRSARDGAGRRRRQCACRARLLDDEEADRYWPRLVEVWPAHETYRSRSGKRHTFVLEPRPDFRDAHARSRAPSVPTLVRACGGRKRGQATVEWSALRAPAGAAVRRPPRLRSRAPTRGASATGSCTRSCVPSRAAARSATRSTSHTATTSPRWCAATRPTSSYERSSAALPIDFRRCRKTDCSDGSDAAREIDRSRAGLPVTAFTRVVDRRAARRRRSTSSTGSTTRRASPAASAGCSATAGPAITRTTGRASRCGSRRAAASPRAPRRTAATARGWSTVDGLDARLGRQPRRSPRGPPRGERSTPASEDRAGATRAPARTRTATVRGAPPWHKDVYRAPESPAPELAVARGRAAAPRPCRRSGRPRAARCGAPPPSVGFASRKITMRCRPPIGS